MSYRGATCLSFRGPLLGGAVEAANGSNPHKSWLVTPKTLPTTMVVYPLTSGTAHARSP